MKREIKFRGLIIADDEPQKMVYFNLPEMDNGLWAWPMDKTICHIDEYVSPLMQFTGLKDKNGKEIYEGDIIGLYYSKDGKETNEIYNKKEVKFGLYNIGANGYEYDFFIHGFYVEDEYLYGVFIENQATVLGNIYENPELINP